MSKKTVYEIEVPFFCGYYESPLFNGDTLFDEFESDAEGLRERFGHKRMRVDNLDIDLEGYVRECNDAFVAAFLSLMGEAMEGLVLTAEVSGMESPKYYNYSTDRLFARVTLCGDWQERLLSFMEGEREWLMGRIKKDWSSRDGFCSFMDNSYGKWLDRMGVDEPDWLYLSVVLGYVLERRCKDPRWSLLEATLENVSVWWHLRYVPVPRGPRKRKATA